MNTQDIVDIMHRLEQKSNNTAQYTALDKLGYNKDITNTLLCRNNMNPYNRVLVAKNIYTQEEIELISRWAHLLKEDNFERTPFAERSFLRNFLSSIPEEEQMNYIINTNKYYSRNNLKYDPDYVLVTRRSLPSTFEKPEPFWSDNPSTTFWGLKKEINNTQRSYSVILVSTLGNLNKHGAQDFLDISLGASDGEIITSAKPFPHNLILFAYKPIDEILDMLETIQNSEITYNQYLSKFQTQIKDRYKLYNKNQNENHNPYIHLSDIDFSKDDWS